MSVYTKLGQTEHYFLITLYQLSSLLEVSKYDLIQGQQTKNKTFWYILNVNPLKNKKKPNKMEKWKQIYIPGN